MFVSRSTTAEQAQRFGAGIPKLVLLAGEDCDGVAGFDLADFPINAHPPGAVGDAINFLGVNVKMFLRAAARGQARFGQALIANGGIAVREEFADFRPVLGDERRDFVQVPDVHGMDLPDPESGNNENRDFALSNLPNRSSNT